MPKIVLIYLFIYLFIYNNLENKLAKTTKRLAKIYRNK